MKRRWWLLVLLLACTLPAAARLGGGESFSSGGGGSSSGGGDAIGLLIELIFRILLYLCLEYPALGIPLTLLVIGFFVYVSLFTKTPEAATVATRYDVDPNVLDPPAVDPTAALKPVDPNFSKPLFLDFVNLLYNRARMGERGLDAYLSKPVAEAIAKDGPSERVVVGAIQLANVNVGDQHQVIEVRLETNLRRSGKDAYAVESWSFERAAGTLSKGPDEMLKLACPSCGNPGEVRADGTCPFCGNVVNTGRFNWVVTSVRTLETRELAPLSSSSGGEEKGYRIPTRLAADLQIQRNGLEARDPSFQWDQFETRVRYIFAQLQKAWSDRNLEGLRPFETDSLFSTHQYWIEAYLAQGLQNRLEDVQIERLKPVRIQPDAFFETITVRIWAAMKDTTVDATGKVLSGSASEPRQFSEYWTCIRRVGAHALKPNQDPDRCPSCGAPLDKVGMTGICGYCNSKITRGDFDWVLSLIEQPEAYLG